MGKTTKKTDKAKRSYPAVTKFYKDQAGEWRWRIKKGRNIIAAATEGYTNYQDCRENYFNTGMAIMASITQVVINEQFNEAHLKAAFITDKKNSFTYIT